MTDEEKHQLISLCKLGLSFERIRMQTSCADSTIRNYMRAFQNE